MTVSARYNFMFACLALIALPLEAGQAQPADRAPDTMAARVLACASCHGAEGQGTSDEYFPRLAGKPSGYLYNQLLAFKDARRKYPPMNYLLEFLPDAYLKKMAEHFASLRPPFPAPAVPTVSNEILARGEMLVKEGDSKQGIPPCSACHGQGLGGMEPSIPGLLGLRASYLSAQLGGWRYGTRTAAAPNCVVAGTPALTERASRSTVQSKLPARPPSSSVCTGPCPRT